MNAQMNKKNQYR